MTARLDITLYELILLYRVIVSLRGGLSTGCRTGGRVIVGSTPGSINAV